MYIKRGVELKLFITATNTDVGKTYTTIKLIETLSDMGVNCGVCKPIETGVEEYPKDASLLLESVSRYNSNFAKLNPVDITAYTFKLPSAPYTADKKGIIDTKVIQNRINSLSKLCDILIIEGAGGLMVPVKRDYFMIDLAKSSDKTLLVTDDKLGCINNTLLSISMLKSYNIDYDWCVNTRENSMFETTTKPFYDDYFDNWWKLEDSIGKYCIRLIEKL